jgi:quercetin dioxygenase-like cupin family protein
MNLGRRAFVLLVGMLWACGTDPRPDLLKGYFVPAGTPRTAGVDRPGRMLVASSDSASEFVIIDTTSAQKLRTPLHVHRDHHEAIYVLSGESKVTVGDETYSISDGDFVFMPKGVPHRLEIVEPGRSLVIASGGYDESSAEMFQLYREGKSFREIYEELPRLEFIDE